MGMRMSQSDSAELHLCLGCAAELDLNDCCPKTYWSSWCLRLRFTQTVRSFLPSLRIELSRYRSVHVVPTCYHMTTASAVWACDCSLLIWSGSCRNGCCPASVMEHVAADQSAHILTFMSFSLTDSACFRRIPHGVLSNRHP